MGKFAMTFLAAAMIVVLLELRLTAEGPKDSSDDSDLEAANKVKEYYSDWLSSIPGVSGVTVGNSDRGLPEIRVEVQQTTPQIKEIPEKLNGIPVVIAPSKEAQGGSLLSSEPAGTPGLLPSPTPEVEISPVPIPQGNPLFPESPSPDALPSP